MIPVFKPHIGPETLQAAREALEMGWLGMGSYVKDFEVALSEYLGLEDGRTCVAVNTCTSALHLALELAGVGPGDEVLSPALNNIGDFQAISLSGARPAFVDIEEKTLGVDPSLLEQAITPNTKAVIPVHYMGIPCDISAIRDIASRNGLRVIEDAAHAIGTEINGQFVGNSGDLVCFSFDPIKTLTCIDGGAVVTNTREEAEQLYPARLLGMTQKNEYLYSNSRATEYDVLGPGYRYHLANLHAAIGISQLRELPVFIQNRRTYCRLYNSLLRDVAEVIVPSTDYEGVSPFNYVVRVLDLRRTDLRKSLAEDGIDSGIHWPPANTFTWLKDSRGAGDLPVTDRVGTEILTLPLWSFMEEELVTRICNSIRRYFGYSPV